jgi:hypothetical protein
MNKTTIIGMAVLAVLATIGMVAPVFASAETATITPVSGFGGYWHVDWHCIWQKDSNGYDICVSTVQQPHITHAALTIQQLEPQFTRVSYCGWNPNSPECN